jgi:hypothetical protein
MATSSATDFEVNRPCDAASGCLAFTISQAQSTWNSIHVRLDGQVLTSLSSSHL